MMLFYLNLYDMKILHKINFYALVVTLLLYITVYLGMLVQMVLGVIQLIVAITITWRYYYDLPINHKKLLHRYWLAVLASVTYIFVAYWLDNSYVNDFFMITSLFVFPMAIACYFVYVTYKLTETLSKQ